MRPSSRAARAPARGNTDGTCDAALSGVSTSRSITFGALMALAIGGALLAPSATAQPAPDKEGWIKTGEGVRKKTVVFVTVDVYAIAHFMKKTTTKSKQAVIDAQTDKKFVWTMLRDVDQGKIEEALRDAYAMNGYTDKPKIDKFIGAFFDDLKKGAHVTITYDAAQLQTSVFVEGGGAATVPSEAFMKGTWSIWFGKIDQPSLGDDLIKYLP